VAYTWESGRRFPFANVVFRGAALNKRSLEGVVDFAHIPRLSVGKPWAASNSAALLKGVCGDAGVGEVARAVRADRTTVARWLRGDSEPRVPQLLKLIDALTHRLVEFVALFVQPESVPMLGELARELAAQRRVAYDLPWSHAVLRALELAEYRASPRHVPGLIARAIGIEVGEEAELLRALSESGLIRRKGGKWSPSRVLTVDTRANPDGDRRLKEHWAEVGLDRLRRGAQPSDAFHSFNLFAVSHADFERLRELHLEYYERVRRIIAESKLAERVVLLNQQLVPLKGK
jgi:transcriptional regulator with XRE-family HTH domain